MEISYAYRIRSENPEKEAQKLTQNAISFGPNHTSFCSFAGKYAIFNCNEKFSKIQLDLKDGEFLTSVGTVYRMPWIISVGSNFGRIFLLSHQTGLIRTIDLHNSPIVQIKEHSNGDDKSDSYNIISVLLKPNIVVLIPSEEIGKLVTDAKYKPFMFKFFLPNEISDLIIIPNNPNQLTLYTTGLHHYISIHTMQRPQKAGSLSKIASSVNIFAKTFYDSQPISNATQQILRIEDDFRNVRSFALSSDSKFLAITDTQGRMSVFDIQTNTFIFTRKDLFDADVAWTIDEKNNNSDILLLYAQKRRTLYIIRAPEFDVIDAIEVEPDGKLFQNKNFDAGNIPLYMDVHGNIALLKLTQKKPNTPKKQHKEPTLETQTDKSPTKTKTLTKDEPESPVKLERQETEPIIPTASPKSYFRHVSLSTKSGNNSDIIQIITDDLALAKPDEDDILKVLGSVKDPILASTAIATIVKFNNVTDDFLKECMSKLQNSLEYEPMSPPSLKRQIDNYLDNFKSSKLLPEDQFSRYSSLVELWQRAQTITQEVVPITEYPTSDITKWYRNEYEHESIEAPKYIPLRLFLAEPMRNFDTLFATLRKGATHHDFIKIMMIVHPSSVDKFLQYFVFWCATITSAHLALIQDVIVGLSQHGQKNALMDFYNNIPDLQAQGNKRLFFRILSM